MIFDDSTAKVSPTLTALTEIAERKDQAGRHVLRIRSTRCVVANMKGSALFGRPGRYTSGIASLAGIWHAVRITVFC